MCKYTHPLFETVSPYAAMPSLEHVAQAGLKLCDLSSPVPWEVEFKAWTTTLSSVFIYLLDLYYLFICVCVCTRVYRCPQQSEEGIRSPKTGVMGSLRAS